MRQGRARHVLPAEVAAALLVAHERTGASYREVAEALDLDVAMWWRLTRGQRAPSHPVAERLITRLDLDEDVAEALRAAAVEPYRCPTPS